VRHPPPHMRTRSAKRPVEIETRGFQMQVNLSQIIVSPAIHHAQVQD
jgi:hypothetical protein